MTEIEMRNMAVNALTRYSSVLIHNQLSDEETIEYLLFIFSVFVNMDKTFDASSIAEDVSFELFKYAQEHDDAFSKWRNKILKGFVEMGDLLNHVIDEEEPVPEPKKEVPNILDLSSQVTKEDECIDLAKNLLSVLNDSRTPSKLVDAISSALGQKGKPLDIENSPEVIAQVLCQEVEK